MLIQICTSELLIELSEQQQELLSGGQDFELTSSNFAQKMTTMEGMGTSQPSGNTANSNVQTKEINNAAQDFFSLDLTNPTSITGIGPKMNP